MKLSQLSMPTENLGQSGTQKYLTFHRFLLKYGMDAYKINLLPSDCSPRRYYRIISELGTQILMDSSLDSSINAFIYIAELLKSFDVRAPTILKSDLNLGYLLIEDFGSDSLTKHLITHPKEEHSIYELCTEVLIKLSKINVLNLHISNYSETLMNNELEIFCDWYLKDNVKASDFIKAKNELLNIFVNLYPQLNQLPQVLTLRDFMADNIMIIKNQDHHPNKIGVIDFQDAVIGNCAYDLFSLLEDARRDVSKKVKQDCKKMYCTALGLEPKIFESNYTIIGLQRSLKIIGIFHRRNTRDSQAQYLDYLPRVWKFVEKSLEHEIAISLKNWFKRYAVPTK